MANQCNIHLQEHASQEVKNLKEKMAKLSAKVRAKKEELDQKEKELCQSQLEKGILTYQITEVRNEMETAQSKIDGLLQEKNKLEQMLKQRELQIELLKLNLSTMREKEEMKLSTMREKQHYLITAKEQEVSQYQKQLDFVKQALEDERKKMTPLQEELQRKTVELTEKSVEIQFLREARDSANSQLKMEKEKAELQSKEVTAAAISHAVLVAELKVL